MDLAFDRANAIGCTCMQIFPSNPRGWGIKPLAEGEAKAFRLKSRTFGIEPVFIHMPYLPNLASSETVIYSKSVSALQSAVDRCEELGTSNLILHLGSHKGAGKKIGMEQAANAINSIEGAKEITFLMENEAGQANSIGSDLSDLIGLYDSVHATRGFCFDTCHAFAAGYDITDLEVLDKIDHDLGMEKIKVVHANDTKYELGSGRDRHENIGFGKIGIGGFRTLFKYGSMRSKPMIMETPMSGQISIGDELKLMRSIVG